MKLNKTMILIIFLLLIIGSVSRVLGFAPQIAMAVFGAAIIKDKKLAFLLPLLSMLFSDLLYQVLYTYGYMEYGGFYEGQVTNYILIMATGIAGLWARNLRPGRIILACIAAPAMYFLTSNFFLWLGGGGFQRPKTMNGLLLCYNDAIPFFRSGMINTLVASAILFGSYFIIRRFIISRRVAVL